MSLPKFCFCKILSRRDFIPVNCCQLMKKSRKLHCTPCWIAEIRRTNALSFYEWSFFHFILRTDSFDLHLYSCKTFLMKTSSFFIEQYWTKIFQATTANHLIKRAKNIWKAKQYFRTFHRSSSATCSFCSKSWRRLTHKTDEKIAIKVWV